MNSNKLESIASSVAKILHRFGFVHADFDQCLKRAMVLEAKRNNLETFVDIARSTGLDRRIIKPLIDEQPVQRKTNKLLLVLGDLHDLKQTGVITIPLKGEDSFFSICKKRANGRLTPTSILNGLVAAGCIHRHNNEIEIVETRVNTFPSENFALEFIGRSFMTTVMTGIHNTNVLDSEICTRFEQIMSSTQINPVKHSITEEQITKILRETKKAVLACLDDNESHVVRDTYPQIGVSINFYKLEN